MKPKTSWMACLVATLALGACGDRASEERAATPQDSAAQPVAPPIPPPNPLPDSGDASVTSDATVGVDVLEGAIRLSNAFTRAGPVSFAVKNAGTKPHTIVVTSATGGTNRTMTIPAGQVVIMTVLLSTGDYEVFCAEGNGAHRTGGELATLAVR